MCSELLPWWLRLRLSWAPAREFKPQDSTPSTRHKLWHAGGAARRAAAGRGPRRARAPRRRSTPSSRTTRSCLHEGHEDLSAVRRVIWPCSPNAIGMTETCGVLSDDFIRQRTISTPTGRRSARCGRRIRGRVLHHAAQQAGRALIEVAAASLRGGCLVRFMFMVLSSRRRLAGAERAAAFAQVQNAGVAATRHAPRSPFYLLTSSRPRADRRAAAIARAPVSPPRPERIVTFSQKRRATGRFARQGLGLGQL